MSRLTAFTASLAALLFLAGCGSDADANSDARPTTTGPTTMTTSPAISDEAALNKIPACGQATCTVMDRADGFESSDGAASILLVTTSSDYGQMQGEIDGRLYVVSDNGLLVWSEPENSAYGIGSFGASGNLETDEDKIYTDASGNAIVQIGVGAHSMNFLVLDISPDGVRDFDSFNSMESPNPSPFFGTSPGQVSDTNGDGTFELTVNSNNYDPSYAEGTVSTRVFGWNGSDYVITQCFSTPAGGQSDEYAPTDGACALPSA